MKKISRKEAKTKGEKYYFTGKPCLNGNISKRYVSNGLCRCEICVVKQKESKKKTKANRVKVTVEDLNKYIIKNKNWYKQFIEDRVEKDPKTGCWNWIYRIDRKEDGYGCTKVLGKDIKTHRLSFLAFKGKITKECVRHKCHNKICCNPSHLRQGTFQQNRMDEVRRRKKEK